MRSEQADDWGGSACWEVTFIRLPVVLFPWFRVLMEKRLEMDKVVDKFGAAIEAGEACQVSQGQIVRLGIVAEEKSDHSRC